MPMPVSTAPPPLLPKKKRAGAPDVSLAWWSWRGCPTRSHSELGRETPQRPWYCASRHGRVGRRQANQTSGPESRDQSSYRPVEVPTDAAPLVRRRCECRTHPSGVRKAGIRPYKHITTLRHIRSPQTIADRMGMSSGVPGRSPDRLGWVSRGGAAR
jgi:hypothetical protein